jgi:hypothetical protein
MRSGVGLADRESEQDCETHFHQDSTGLMIAADYPDYPDYVVPVIGRLGEESSTRRAQHMELTDFGSGLPALAAMSPGKVPGR